MTLMKRMMQRQFQLRLHRIRVMPGTGLWRLVGHAVWHLFKVALYLAVAFALSLAVLLLPSGFDRGDVLSYYGHLDSTFDLHLYGQAITSWQWVSSPQAHRMLAELPEAARLTGTLLLASAVLAVLVGVPTGYLLSRYGRRKGHRAAWVTVTLLSSLPDILMVVGLQVGLYLLGQAMGVRIPVYGAVAAPMTWKHYLLPVIALTLLPLPYLARVVASALEEAGSQQYVQAAMARGVPWQRVLWHHIGPNALIRVLASLPGVLGVLLSADPVVEYMASFHGLGKQMIAGLGGQLVLYQDGYMAAFCLLPLLLIVSVAHRLTSAGQERLNPLQGAKLETGPIFARENPGEWLRTLPRAIAEVGWWLWDQLLGMRTGPRRSWRAVRTNPTLLCGVLLTGFLLFVALAAGHLAPYALGQRQMARMEGATQLFAPFAPNPLNWLGSDRYGRDVLSGLIWGTRYALLIALLTVSVRLAIALPLGLMAAWRRGVAERLVQTLAAVFTGLPAVLLPLALIPMVNAIWMEHRGAMIVLGILALALPGAPRLAEAIRLAAREVLHSPYLEGGRAAGASPTWLLLHEVLPNIAPTLTVLAALDVPLVLTTTAFLGLRMVYVGGTLWDPDAHVVIGPALPEWGSMIESPFSMFLLGRWWLWAPFGALFVAVLAFTLLGEGLRRQAVTHRTWG